MARTEGVKSGDGAGGRLAFLVTAVLLGAVVIIATGLEWGILSVNYRLVVSEPGMGEWQGVVAFVAAVAGMLVIGFAMALGRRAIAAMGALISGLVIAAMAIAEVVHLVTRPADIAAVVRAGAAAIPLKGYRMPPIESSVGPGTWLALIAGLLLTLVGLLSVIIPAWRSRRGTARGYIA